jgi:hypothetical protein
VPIDEIGWRTITSLRDFLLMSDANEKSIVERPKVGWYDPLQLLRTALMVVTSTIFGRNADHRLIEALASEATAPQLYDYNADERPFWLDYISDTGDGWDATFTVAFFEAQPELTLPLGGGDVVTERGSILVFGGDEVYPTASLYEYQTRLVAPYAAALPPTTTDAPHVFAVPGNHDWYDSLVSFSRLFCSKDFFARWRAPQERSYFALRLPRGWWLLGTDIQLGSDLDRPQQHYFEEIAKQIRPDDRIILCHAEPHWIYESIYRPDPRNPMSDPAYWAYRALDTLEWLLGGRVAVYLAGDLHHYCRHEDENHVQKIVAGGGGAFLHLTNGQDVTTLTNPRTGAVFHHRVSWPDRAQSNLLCLKNLLFPIYNPWFGAATGALYTLVAWAVMAPEIGKEHSLWAALGVVLDHVVRDPGAAFSVIAIFVGFVVFTDTHSTAYRWIAGPIHGLAHLAALFFIGWGAAALTAPSGHPSAWRLLLVSLPILVFGGYLAGGLIMGLYLFVSLRFFRRHQNEASSSLGSEDWKNFLRLRIAEDGTLTIFPIGIRRVARRKRAAAAGETASRFIPEGGSTPELIEPPIVVAAPSAAPALRTSTDPAPPRQA